MPLTNADGSPFFVVPTNVGPRTMDYYSSRSGRIEPSAAIYWESGGPNFSLNTDSQIIPEDEFFLQGAMSARQGADSYQMLRALTIHPARAFGCDDRVGSLEVGKDADVVMGAISERAASVRVRAFIDI